MFTTASILESRALRTAAKLWYVKMLADQQTVPVPLDAQEALSGAPDPDRVLLVGNGPTHGWGTLTHDLALTGQLARTCTVRSGRPTDVRYIGAETMSVASALPWLGDRPLQGHDLVLVVLSMNDALRLTPVPAFRADMVRLLETLVARTRPSAPIVVAGIHPVASLPHYRGPAARIAQRHADRLNAVTRELVAGFDRMRFLELSAPDPDPERPFGSPALYAEWSAVFADACVPALDAVRVSGADRSAVPESGREWDWAPGERIVTQSAAPGGALDDLVQDAKSRFGVDLAYVTLVDGDRQHYLANTAPGSREVPLELSHCRETVRGDDLLVVENSFKDDRFRASPLLDLTQLRFYAGIPLKNAEGENVGTFCLSSVLPRSKGSVPEAELRRYAALAEEELQRMAAQPVARTEPAISA